jgi:hypothetical protein
LTHELALGERILDARGSELSELLEFIGERYGLARLRRFLSAHASAAPQPLLQALDAELHRFRGGEVTDDIATFALTPNG